MKLKALAKIALKQKIQTQGSNNKKTNKKNTHYIFLNF